MKGIIGMKIAITTDMIYCKIKTLIANKELAEKRKITYKVIQDETGLSSTTIAKLLNFRGIQRIDGTTLDKLCEFFHCNVGDILMYMPDSVSETFDDRVGNGLISHVEDIDEDKLRTAFRAKMDKLTSRKENDDGTVTWYDPNNPNDSITVYPPF